jgi:hypothetical protein
MFVLLQAVDDVSVPAVEHSFWANNLTTGVKKNSPKSNAERYRLNDSFIVIVT